METKTGSGQRIGREGENMADTEAAGQGHKPRGAGPQVTVISPPPTSWAAHLSQVTPEAAGSVPSQGWVAVGGAEVKIRELNPNAFSLLTPIPRVPGEEGRLPPSPVEMAVPGELVQCSGGAAGLDVASLTPISPDDWARGLAPLCCPPQATPTAFGISKPCSQPQ